MERAGIIKTITFENSEQASDFIRSQLLTAPNNTKWIVIIDAPLKSSGLNDSIITIKVAPDEEERIT